ncbi:TonB-dependent receptor domain-containing protein [Hyalangium versicolor]|uniref:TonB-dependent receptor domain-containing protein n=1 Tax=Hyalangium versicolor TaxID=2861190 RepID=UPI001CC9B3BC|nr:TonB-dependent receptor [Hyalangium versicolor]
MSRVHTSKGSKVSKQSTRKNTVLALAVLVSGTGGTAVAQEAPAPAPATQEAAPPAPAPAPQAQPPADAPVQQPIESTQPQAPVTPKAQPAPKPAAKPAAAEPVPEEEYVEEIVVTGSRIPRKELTTAAPVTVLDRQQIEKTGKTSIGEILQNLPEQSNAINTQYNNGGDGSTRVNLRGLGAERTLVLLNGRRHVAGGTGADATVDLNAIPTAAIQRIEILKDGGSAVYGSDAISGVVNIITRKDFSGTELRAFSGISSHGDGALYDLSLTTGQSTERGSVLFTAGYYTQKDVFAGDRGFSEFARTYNWQSRKVSTSGSVYIPEGAFFIYDRVNGNATWNDLLSRYPDDDAFIRGADGYRPFDLSGVPEAGGDLYNYQPINYLVTPSQRAHMYSTGGVRLGTNSRAFFEASYTNRQSSQQLAPEPLSTAGEGLTISSASIYNPFGVDLTPDTVEVLRRLTEFGPRYFQQDITTFRIVTGLEGKLDEDFGPLKDWHWDVAYNYGRTQGIDTKQGTLQVSRLQAALGPSFIDPSTGLAVCGTPEAPIGGGCSPLNLLGGPGTISREAVNYLSFRGTARGFTQQTSITANLGGELFRVSPTARPAGLALGYEHRREGGANIPDPITNAGDTTGNKVASTEGRYYVNEGYMELSVPVLGETNSETGELRDVLEVSGAARAFNYNTFGSDFTYKFGTRVSVIPDFTLRATWSTAFRAPSVNELFLGQTDSFVGVKDPCASDARTEGSALDQACDAQGVPDGLSDPRLQQRTLLGGNAKLKPETAKILTVGVVFEPQFLKDVSATVDYYNIAVDDSITELGTDVILNNCYPTANGVTPQYCEKVHRSANGLINFVDDPLTNVGGDRTGGIDISLRYSPQTPFGRVGLSADATWLQKFDRTLANGRVLKAKGNYDLQEVHTDWVGMLGASWARDAASAAVNMRFVNGFKECQNNDCQEVDGASAPISRTVKDYYTFDANVGYDFETKLGTLGAQIGVNNIFDAKPAVVYNGFLASSDASTYDYMGRYFYARLSYNYY